MKGIYNQFDHNVDSMSVGHAWLRLSATLNKNKSCFGKSKL